MILGQFQAAVECYESALDLGESFEQLSNNLAHARHYGVMLQGVDAHGDGKFRGEQALRTARIRLPDNADRSLLERQPVGEAASSLWQCRQHWKRRGLEPSRRTWC